MLNNDGYWRINCRFPIENKTLTIELPLDINFKLNVLASKQGTSSEKLASTIIMDYIKNNCKNKVLEDFFK